MRTHQTAEPLARACTLTVEVHDGLREIEAGEKEMCRDPESKRIYVDTAFGWSAGADNRLFGGECGSEFLARYDAAIATITAARTGTAVVVSHGAAIRCWVAARAGNVSPNFAREHALANTASVIVEHSGGRGWHAICWNSEPLGGAELGSHGGDDPTGDPLPTS